MLQTVVCTVTSLLQMSRSTYQSMTRGFDAECTELGGASADVLLVCSVFTVILTFRADNTICTAAVRQS